MDTPTSVHLSKSPNAQIRIGDAERRKAAELLQEHFTAGRLTWEELDERLGQAWGARTHGDLEPLFVDLPEIPAEPPALPKRRRPHFSLDTQLLWMVIVAMAMIGIVVLSRGVALIPVAWWFFGGRNRFGSRCRHPSRHHPRFPGG